MTRPIDPLRPYGERRQARRRAEDRDDQAPGVDGGTNLPVPIEAEAEEKPRAEPKKADAASAFAAHLYGQENQRRGLRGGKPVLDTARATYLGTEFSGPADRRPPKGLLKKTDI